MMGLPFAPGNASPSKEFYWLACVCSGIVMCQIVQHHRLSMFSIVLALISDQAQIYVLMILFTMSTAPFVNLRCYLDVPSRKNSSIYICYGVALFLVGW